MAYSYQLSQTNLVSAILFFSASQVLPSNVLVCFTIPLLSSFLCFSSCNTGKSVVQLTLEFTTYCFCFGATGFDTTRISLNELPVLPPQWVEHMLEVSAVWLDTSFDDVPFYVLLTFLHVRLWKGFKNKPSLSILTHTFLRHLLPRKLPWYRNLKGSSQNWSVLCYN